MSATAGATLAVIGGIMQAQGEYQEGRYASQVSKANARVLEANADKIRLETAINEDVQRQQNRRTMSRNYAASIEQGMGESQTTIGVLGQQATDLEQNVLNLRYKGLSEAEKLDIEASYKRQEAKQLKKQAKRRFYTGLLNAGLSGATTYVGLGGTSNG